MKKPRRYISDVCPACHAFGQHVFTGDSGEYLDCDVTVSEFLYECCSCNENIWIDEQQLQSNK